jgi:hypothetical protein
LLDGIHDFPDLQFTLRGLLAILSEEPLALFEEGFGLGHWLRGRCKGSGRRSGRRLRSGRNKRSGRNNRSRRKQPSLHLLHQVAVTHANGIHLVHSVLRISILLVIDTDVMLSQVRGDGTGDPMAITTIGTAHHVIVSTEVQGRPWQTISELPIATRIQARHAPDGFQYKTDGATPLAIQKILALLQDGDFGENGVFHFEGRGDYFLETRGRRIFFPVAIEDDVSDAWLL